MASTIVRTKKRRHAPGVSLAGPGGPWHAAAPRRLQETYSAIDDANGWSLWREHLSKRRWTPISRLLRAKTPALYWALPGVGADAATVELIELLDALARKKKSKSSDFEKLAGDWQQGANPTADARVEFAALAWCSALPQLVNELSAATWWKLAERIILAAREQSSEPLTSQLQGELALSLAYTLPELAICTHLSEIGREAISQGIAAFLDGQGLPHASYRCVMRPLLASWTRSKAIGEKLVDGWANRTAAQQYPLFVQNVLRQTRADGRQVFTPTNSPKLEDELLENAVALADDDETSAVLRALRDSKRAKSKNLPEAPVDGEWAGIGMLRTDWTSASPSLCADYAGPDIVFELNNDRRCLWSGNWELYVGFNDSPLEPSGKWEQVCWLSDEDVDYLELETQLSLGVTVQRHMLLARKDRFLFLADAVLGIQQGCIEYRGRLPMKGFSTFSSKADTREGFVKVRDKAVAQVLPLALPEWRSSHARGSLTVTDSGLELAQSAQGQCLFAPLFIDLDRRRFKKQLTWRQLTVAQSREIVPEDVAAGYRVQIGKAQWVIYRSLSTPDVRTVLGRNLMTETFVGQFKSDGRIETLLEIE